MRTALFAAILLFAVPALAEEINGLPSAGTPVATPADGVPNLADNLYQTLFANTSADNPMPTPPRPGANEPPLPPSPPPVTYEVWVYHWNGQQYVKQESYTLQTTDIKKAAGYWCQCNNFAGWAARANTPDACITHIVIHDPIITNEMAVPRPPQPPLPTFMVWAYKLTDGKWVKDDKFSWTIKDAVQAWEYTKNVNAVPGWCATNNCPPILPESRRFYEGGLAHGSPVHNYYYTANGEIDWDETYYYYTHHYHHHHH
jgi:hypothetical protein